MAWGTQYNPNPLASGGGGTMSGRDAYGHPDTYKDKTAKDTQVGGDHYKHMKIQPMEYSMANNLNACQHTAIKYITRYKTKGGKMDLEKAIHCIQLLIEMEYSA
jgi:hypothetical protein